jgi:tRNA-specific 2-thiouridylase
VARVFVAMSGGVDSSVSAALLLEQGHDVTGVTMQLWPSSDDPGGCCSVDAIRDARRVCDLLGVAHYSLNFRDEFEREVVRPYAEEYAAGRTPNPCVRCNERLKFSDLLARVAAQGADFLATGHYARIVPGSDGRLRLARAVDSSKDQSYFLYRLTGAQLARVMFPVGELTKDTVRAMAERLGLHVHAKPDSQDVCFVSDGLDAVVGSREPRALAAGPIVDGEGRVLGEHQGIAHFTVGQRHGLGIGGPLGPLFVTSIDAARNAVVVGPRTALEVRHLEAAEVVWRDESTVRDVVVQTRYRLKPVAAVARVTTDCLTIDLDSPILGVAPGQAVVCYAEDVVLGGGTIERTR